MALTAPPLAPPQDLALVAPDLHVIAKNIVSAKQRKLHGAPSSYELANAITNVQLNGVKKGSPTIVVSLYDEEWRIFDSGLFDTDENSEIDPIDLNYPDGSRYWWRLTQVSPKSDHTMDLTFMVREAVELMSVKGPLKGNRAQMTRAEFIQMAVKKAKVGIEFYSQELKIKEPIAPFSGATGSTASTPSNAPASKQPAGHASKSPGLGNNTAGLTCKGRPLTPTQIGVVNTLLDRVRAANGSTVLMVAIIYAGMGETSLGDDAGTFSPNSAGAIGVLQGTDPYWKQGSNAHNVAAQADAFCHGGHGFNSGLTLSQQTSNPAEIAIRVEVPSIWPSDAYAAEWPGGEAAGVAEAQKIVQAAGGGQLAGGVGGGAGGTITTIEAYYFEINPNETYWDGILRLADEVAWDLYMDGNRMYYDSEPVLTKAKPYATIHRDDAQVGDWSYDWDARAIVTQMQLVLIVDMFELVAGEVLVLEGFGPASTSSTVKLPGRWLIDNFQRNKGDITTSLQLVQPAKPKLEPAPQIKTSTVSGSPGSGSGGGTGPGGLTNPVPGASISRLDMGIDGTGHTFVAPFSGVVKVDARGGWGGGGYVAILNDDQSGPDYTRAFYIAEGIYVAVKAGDHVNAGEKIADAAVNSYNGVMGNFEMGPANTSNFDPLAKSASNPKAMVMAFYNWMRGAGIPATTDPSNAGYP